ncbi:unnamed protein product [Arabidopsis thaliana]|uniref:(thale cress) hypothetical protein n=1 Tax=Arabidopsis thaliana TaxID=3702 RepID=A0A7G2ESA3_ARATH|nr:unnamed protein product [Arabidopsis thaliana]
MLSMAVMDEVKLSYQWPKWMMGPYWTRANSIYIVDDEDMTLFMAIRADLDEVHLRVKVIHGGVGKSVNYSTSHLDLGGMTAEEISDNYWNSAETRSIWDSALTRLLTRNVGVVNGSASDLQPRVNETVEGPRRINVNAGIRIEEPIDATPLRASVPKPSVDGDKRKASAKEKGKGQVIESTLPLPVLTTGLPKMTLGGQQMGAAEATAGTKTARALDYEGDVIFMGSTPPAWTQEATSTSKRQQVIGKLMRTPYVGVGRGPRPNELRKMLRQEFSLNVSRKIAMDNTMGSAMGSFALIQPYFKLLMATNPNSIPALETETDNLGVICFMYLFFASNASIKGYAYMIKVVVIDGTHLRGRYGAQMEDNILPPKVNDMVIENFEKGAGYGILKIGDGLYEVRDMVNCGYAVNLWERTCTCRQFQLLTIPCSHAIAAAIREGVRVNSMVGRKSSKRCTRCRSVGHNRATCKGPMTDEGECKFFGGGKTDG